MYSNDQSSKSATYVDMLFDSLLKVMNTEKKKINSIHSTRLQLKKKEFKKYNYAVQTVMRQCIFQKEIPEL